MPDQMSSMMEQKVGHPKSGANCAWVPSPTAATLHSLHYHKVNVFEEQDKIKSRVKAKVENILEIPIAISFPIFSIQIHIVLFVNEGVSLVKKVPGEKIPVRLRVVPAAFSSWL